MKYIYLLIAVFVSSLLSAADLPTFPEENAITYTFLTSQQTTDHVIPLKKLFQHKKINTFLEFGLGVGTKFYIDNCNKVISVELIGPTGDRRFLPWYLKTVAMFWHHTNWHPHLVRCSPLMDRYNTLARSHILPKENFTAYLQEVDAICSWAVNNDSIDLVFIDQGLWPRGHFVNALFGKVNIIAAHDTNDTVDVPFRGYDQVKDDPNYVKIVYKKGQGTTFWIKKEEKELIQYLQKAFQE
jgi:hypothetical protein